MNAIRSDNIIRINALHADHTVYRRWEDYELDVSKKRGGPTEILDEEEFIHAIEEYNYSNSFVDQCRRTLESAIAFAERWTWSNDSNNLREYGSHGI